MIERSRCAAIVTAAGGSTRMGTPKALVEVRGRPLLESQLDALAGFGQRIVVLGAHATEIRQALGDRLTGAHVLENPDWPTGRSSSLRVAFAAVGDDAVAIAVTGVDQPLQEATLQALLIAFEPAVQSYAVPMVGDRRGHPLLLSARLRDPHLRGLADDTTLRAILEPFAATAIAVRVESVASLANLNTPADVARFEKS